MGVFKITRRQLLVGLGGVTVVAGGAGLWLGLGRVRGMRFRHAVDRTGLFAPSAYLALDATGIVTIWLTRSEMGQGVSTALPMLVAEEMDADWNQIRVAQAEAGPRYDYGDQHTVGSASTRLLWFELRRAGAVAREMLLAAGALELKVPASECSTADGQVRHTASGRSASYGQLANLAGRQWAPLRPRLKDPGQFRIIGTPRLRLDLADKVSGTAVFGLDVRLPKQRFAAIARSPQLGGTVKAFDDSRTRALPGVVTTIAIASGIAVVAETTHAAFEGRRLLQLDWNQATGGEVSSSAIRAQLVAATLTPGQTTRTEGQDLLSGATEETFEAVYELPYVAHATLEPMNCTAHVREGVCEVWAPTQDPEGARAAAAQTLNLPVERVTVNKTYLGGGFGRRASHDFVVEAVELAAKLGEPVQVAWSREDDLRHGRHREAAVIRLRALLDNDTGRPRAWLHRVATARPTVPDRAATGIGTMGATDMPYAVANVRVEWAAIQAPVATTIWRSVGYSYNTFGIECFIDELAARAKMDPVDYRLALLDKSPRLKHCVERVAELAAWSAAAADGRHLGIAACACFDSFVAQVVELDLEGTPSAEDQSASADPSTGYVKVTRLPANIRVRKIWCVVDCGTVVNPDTVAAQLEGGIVFGLTAALYGRLSIEQGAVQESNFNDYPLVRLDESPEIEVELVSSGDPPGGVGELAVPPIAPAVANAVFAATGVRLRTMPLALAPALP